MLAVAAAGAAVICPGAEPLAVLAEGVASVAAAGFAIWPGAIPGHGPTQIKATPMRTPLIFVLNPCRSKSTDLRVLEEDFIKRLDASTRCAQETVRNF